MGKKYVRDSPDRVSAAHAGWQRTSHLCILVLFRHGNHKNPADDCHNIPKNAGQITATKAHEEDRANAHCNHFCGALTHAEKSTPCRAKAKFGDDLAGEDADATVGHVHSTKCKKEEVESNVCKLV